MIDFSPANLPSTLVEVDLSFNKLKSIPKAIETLYEANNSVKLNLRNNDFWYTMYSDLSPSLISNETVNEHRFAHRINLISTVKMRYAVDILNKRKYTAEAKWLASQVDIVLQGRKHGVENTSLNPQNVHLISVQDTVKDAILTVLNLPVNRHRSILDGAKEFSDYKKVSEFLKMRASNVAYHSGYQVSYTQLFEHVYSYIKESPLESSLLVILKDEIDDGVDTCLTGQMTRLVNTLNGLVPGIAVTISKTEELSNSIVAMRRKYAIMYGESTDLYIQETVPAVWQLLEDSCIPEHEQGHWLEFV